MVDAKMIAALASSEVAVVQTALDQLATLAISSSVRNKNAITALLGIPTQADEDEGEGEGEGDDDDEDGDDFDDDDGEDGGDDDDDDEADEGDDDGGATIQARSPWSNAAAGAASDGLRGATEASRARPEALLPGALPPIDDALDRHLAQLAPSTLAHLFGALFHDCHDNFPAAARIAAEVARRGDVTAQLALVEAFIAANAHHDTGHRTEDAVLDVLIDEVFPTLGAPALTRLLAWCTNSYLDDAYGDRMYPLFLAAFSTGNAIERATLVKRLEAFMREITELQPDRADGLWSSFDSLTGPAHADVVALRDRLEVGMTDGRAPKTLRQPPLGNAT